MSIRKPAHTAEQATTGPQGDKRTSNKKKPTEKRSTEKKTAEKSPSLVENLCSTSLHTREFCRRQSLLVVITRRFRYRMRGINGRVEGRFCYCSSRSDSMKFFASSGV